MNADNGGDCYCVLALGCAYSFINKVNLMSTLRMGKIKSFKSSEIKSKDVRGSISLTKIKQTWDVSFEATEILLLNISLWGFYQQLSYKLQYLVFWHEIRHMLICAPY